MIVLAALLPNELVADLVGWLIFLAGLGLVGLAFARNFQKNLARVRRGRDWMCREVAAANREPGPEAERVTGGTMAAPVVPASAPMMFAPVFQGTPDGSRAAGAPAEPPR